MHGAVNFLIGISALPWSDFVLNPAEMAKIFASFVNALNLGRPLHLSSEPTRSGTVENYNCGWLDDAMSSGGRYILRIQISIANIIFSECQTFIVFIFVL